MIDNYDSFTFNLVHYFESLQQDVIVKRNDEITLEEITALAPDYLVISPGPCDPDAAGISLQVIEHFAGKIPLLGVCLGHQSIAQFFGGKVIRANKVMHGKTSDIYHNGQGLFEHIANPMRVTRYHSLIVETNSLPKEFIVTAWTKNDDHQPEEIMAIAHRSLPIVGVQFHPESILTEQGLALLKNFLTKYTNSNFSKNNALAADS